MESGRMPACDIIPLAGEHVVSVPKHLLHSENINYSFSMQVLKGGNRCGHDKNKSISFIPSILHKKRPPILEKSKYRLKKLYINPFSCTAGQMSYNANKRTKRGAYRKIRSEMRALVNGAVGECLLHYLDLKTMYVGFQSDKKFHYLGIDFIYKAIKESLINNSANESVTYDRVRRALKIYEECGYIRIEQEKLMRLDGTFYSKPAKIRFNRSFFEDLDIDLHLIAQSLKNEEKRLNSEVLNKKATEYAYQKRLAKKSHKKAMRAINEIFKSAKQGRSLSVDEKKLLDEEYPGHQRRRPHEPTLYPEFISKLIKKPPI